MKCIWMEAEVVDYKICDMDFNCDSCAFHSQLTGCKQFENKSIDSGIIPTVEISVLDPNPAYFHPGVQYYRNHCWIKHIGKNTVLIGLDEFFLNLLYNIKSVLLAVQGTELNENSSFGWIVISCGMVCLKIPFSAQVLELNNQVQEIDVNEFCKQELVDQWLLKLNINDEEIDRDKWLTKQQYIDLLSDDATTIKKLIKDHSTLQNYGTIASGGRLTSYKNQNKFTIPKNLLMKIARQVFNNNHLFI